MAHKAQTALTFIVALAVGLAPPLQQLAWAQATAAQNANATRLPNSPYASTITRSDYEACQAQDEAAFRSAIETITLKSLRAGLRNVDYRAIVSQEWRDANVDEILDKRVDIAVADIRKETSWGALLKSLAYKEQAQKLATDVAERVYRSEAVKDALEAVAGGVGRQVGERINYASEDAANPAAKCVRAFLGTRYGSTIAEAVTSDTSSGLKTRETSGGAEVTSGAVLRESSGGIAGAAILLIRRQLANLARSVGQRLVGSILSRLVSVVAGGIGIVLIAKDIWDLRYGVLPIIANEMKASTTKEKVREELAIAMEAQISDQIGTIATATADRVVEIWHNFKAAHAKALDLAERDTTFRSFLDGLRANELARLDEVVSLTLASEGEAGLFKRVENGSLRDAVRNLPDNAMRIARENRSIDDALKWTAVAGDKLDRVVTYGIHRQAKPRNFTQTSLNRVLALGDRVAITRMARLDATARESLFELKPDALTELARSLTAEELTTLASYLTGLRQAPREQILSAIAKTPSKMRILAPQRVRDAVVASVNQDAAVHMMLRNAQVFEPQTTWSDFKLAWEGQVSPSLLVEKHPISLAAIIILLLMAVLMLRRLFTGGSRRLKTVKTSATDTGENANASPSADRIRTSQTAKSARSTR